MTLRPFAVAVCVLFLVAACGGAGSDDSAVEASSPAETSQTTEAPTQSAPTQSAATNSTETESAEGEPKSLDEYLGVAGRLVRGGGGAGGGAGALDTEQLAAEQQLIEQQVQLCMQAQGFEYTPERQTGLRVFLAVDNQGLSAADYAETEGFGISTRFDALFDGDLDLTEDASPNDEYVATLSDGEADAYEVALRGAPPERNAQGQLIDPETGEVLQGQQGRRGLDAAGCRGDAQTAVRGDFSELSELEDEFIELEERIAADSRIAEIGRDWADCVRDAGFAYETEDEARAEIRSQFQPLLRGLLQASNTNQGDGQGQGQGQGGNRLERLSRIELTPEQDAELNTLQDLERVLAVQSLECQGDTAEEVAEITARYESEFVDANRAALESFAS